MSSDRESRLESRPFLALACSTARQPATPYRCLSCVDVQTGTAYRRTSGATRARPAVANRGFPTGRLGFSARTEPLNATTPRRTPVPWSTAHAPAMRPPDRRGVVTAVNGRGRHREERLGVCQRRERPGSLGTV